MTWKQAPGGSHCGNLDKQKGKGTMTVDGTKVRALDFRGKGAEPSISSATSPASAPARTR